MARRETHPTKISTEQIQRDKDLRQDPHDHSSSSESSFGVSSFSFACELSELVMGLKIKAVSFDSRPRK